MGLHALSAHYALLEIIVENVVNPNRISDHIESCVSRNKYFSSFFVLTLPGGKCHWGIFGTIKHLLMIHTICFNPIIPESWQGPEEPRLRRSLVALNCDRKWYFQLLKMRRGFQWIQSLLNGKFFQLNWKNNMCACSFNYVPYFHENDDFTHYLHLLRSKIPQNFMEI